MKEKKVKFYCLYDMRNDNFRTRKTKPNSKESPFEFVIPIELNFKIPELEVRTLKAEIDIPAGEVNEMVTDLIERKDEEQEGSE